MAKSFREALKIKGRNAIYGNGFEINYHAKNWIKVDFDLQGVRLTCDLF